MTIATDIPDLAARLPAGLALDAPKPDGDTVPLKITARTAEPVDHWWFGRCVHDMAGMQQHKARLPVDYCHDPREVIGYADNWTAGEDLTAAGALIAMHPRVVELREAAAAGVPFEASIAFEESPLVIEEVPPGMTAEANGRTYEGPVVIFRRWNLRGVAICPYGYDRHTAAEFSRNHPRQKETAMAHDAKPTDATPADQTAATPTPDQPADNAAPDTQPADQPAEDPTANQPTDQATPEPVAAGTGAMSQPSQPDGRRFLEAFGQDGAVWFAEGKTFDEARDLFIAKLSTENAELRQRLDQAAASAGDPEPAGFSAADDQTTAEPGPREKHLQLALGDRLAAFASSLKLN